VEAVVVVVVVAKALSIPSSPPTYVFHDQHADDMPSKQYAWMCSLSPETATAAAASDQQLTEVSLDQCFGCGHRE
jgi:hypothetical protein